MKKQKTAGLDQLGPVHTGLLREGLQVKSRRPGGRKEAGKIARLHSQMHSRKKPTLPVLNLPPIRD